MGETPVIEVEHGGKIHYLAFTLNVMEELQTKYDSIYSLFDELGKAEDDPMKIDMKMLIDLFEEMLIEGYDIHNERTGEELVPPSHKQAGRIIQAIGLNQASGIFRDLIVKSNDAGKKPKNT